MSLIALGEQQRTATKLDAFADAVQQLKDVVRAKLTVLDELKKSLLHQAFSGAL